MSRLRKLCLKLAPLIGLLLCACNNDPRPDYCPNNEQMAWILTQIHLVEAACESQHTHLGEESHFYYKQILESNHLTAEQMDSCLSWYSRNENEYIKVYNRALNILQTARYSSNTQFEAWEEAQSKTIQPSLWDTLSYTFTFPDGGIRHR